MGEVNLIARVEGSLSLFVITAGQKCFCVPESCPCEFT